jgi:hypothetical protein
MNDLGLNDVRMSFAVAQAGTLTAATREGQLTTSTVSRAVTRLEKHLGVFLVQRRRGIRRIWTVAHWLRSVWMCRNNGLRNRCHRLGEIFRRFKSGRHNQKQTMRNASYNRGRHLPRDQASCGRHPWLWFDEHLWLTCRICEARPRWHASVLSGIVSRRVERGTQGRESDDLCAIIPQAGARNKTQ